MRDETDKAEEDQHPSTRWERWVNSLVGGLALIGGVLLAAMALMQVASVALRAILGSPIPGDFEIVQLASAVIVFCFLPFAHFHGHNFRVTFFTDGFGRRGRTILDSLAHLSLLAIAALLLWRMGIGIVDLHKVAEHTMILEIPIWWAFVPILGALCVLIVAIVAALFLREEED